MGSMRVALFEHERETQDLMRGAVSHPAGGHEVVSEARSFGGALHVISLMRDGFAEVDAVILDPNIRNGVEDYHDAKIIVERLRGLELTPKIITYSSVPIEAEVAGAPVDFHLFKGETRPFQYLGAVLSSF
jgi:hypothetical protein